MNLTDRFDALISNGLRPFQAGEQLGLTKGQTARAWTRIKNRRAGPIVRQPTRRKPRGEQAAPILLEQPRDPCPRCGARGDYPCGHAPVGRLLCL